MCGCKHANIGRFGGHHQLAIAQQVQRMAKGEAAKVVGNKHVQVGGEQVTQPGWKKNVANVARLAGFVAKRQDTDKRSTKRPAVEPDDERDIYIQRVLDEQAELVAQLEEQKNQLRTRASPRKEELTEKLKQAEKTAAKAKKDEQTDRLRQPLPAMDEDSSQSEDETNHLMRMLQSKKEKQKTSSQEQEGDTGKKKSVHKETEPDMRRMIRNLKRKREPDEDEEDSEDNKYVHITKQQQALKVIKLTGLRCSNPNRVAQFINQKFKFHNLADMWPALCAVVDGGTDRPLLLAVDAPSYEAYMGGRTMR